MNKIDGIGANLGVAVLNVATLDSAVMCTVGETVSSGGSVVREYARLTDENDVLLLDENDNYITE